MITSKFIWDAFKKYKDEIAFIGYGHTEKYSDLFLSIKKIAIDISPKFSKGEKVAIEMDYSLKLIFALLYNGITPVLLAKDMPHERIEVLLKSIKCNTIIDSTWFLKPSPQVWNKKFDPQITEDATVIFTSGSTSIPKAVQHTFSNHYYSALGANENLNFQKGDKWLLSLPLHHIGGLSIIFRALLSGGTLVGNDRTIPLEYIIDYLKATHISVVPTQLRRMLLYPEKLRSLKAILVGGGMIPDDLISQALDLNLPIYKTYGLSEMSSQVTTTSQNASSEELTTSGKILNYRELKIADDNEILVRGEVLCKKYLNAKINIDSEGWFHTGDLGSIDSSGYLTVYGRKDNMFISGGENIYPEPIEKIILKMDSIIKACIVPKNDKKFGQVPVLFYKLSPNTNLSIEKLNEYLQNKVQKFEIPKEIYPFPKDYTDLGIKLNRTFLKNFIANL